MSTELVCFSCQHTLSADTLFCENCGILVRCKTCRSLLNVGARFCGACGTPVGQNRNVEYELEGQKGNGIVFEEPTISTHAPNKFKYKKKGKDVDFEGEFTDDFGYSMGAAFSSLIAGQIVPSTSRRPQARAIGAVSPQLALPMDSVGVRQETVEGEVSEIPKVELSNAGRLRRIFLYEGENGSRLRLDRTDLKASGQLDYSKRLTYLFLLAIESQGKNSILKSDIYEIVRRDAVADPNFSGWLSNNKSHFHYDGEGVSLRQTGRDHALEILQGIEQNVDGKSGWTPNDRSPKRAKSGKAESKSKTSSTNNLQGEKLQTEEEKTHNESIPTTGTHNASSSQSKSISQDVSGWAKKWKSLDLIQEAYGYFNGRSPIDKIMFGLWAISNANDNFECVVSRDKIVAFLHVAIGIKMSVGGKTDETIQKEGAGKIIKVPGGYQLLPNGVKYIKDLCDGFKRR